MAEVEVRDDERLHHWEAVVDGEVAGFAQYHRDGDTITFVHTEVADRFGGQGLGTRIVEASLEAARRDHLTVVPTCPFYARWFDEHPEARDLLG